MSARYVMSAERNSTAPIVTVQLALPTTAPDDCESAASALLASVADASDGIEEGEHAALAHTTAKSAPRERLWVVDVVFMAGCTVGHERKFPQLGASVQGHL